MGKLPNASKTSASSDVEPRRSDAMYLITTMADTTWRMFVPVVALLLIGNWLDHKFATKPWLLLVGALLGIVIAGLLIKNQLVKGKKI